MTGAKGSRRARRPQRGLRFALARRSATARLVLIWEQVWPALWPPLGLVGGFLAAALFGLFTILPGWAHAGLLALGAAAALALLVRGLARVRLPEGDAARRRIEDASGLAHRPLTALDDTLALGAGDPSTEALWRAHLARAAAAVTRLRTGWPHPGLARRDPRALRIALGLVLVIAVFAAGWDAPQRVAAALSPDFGPLAAAEPASIDLWVTPPAYTGRAPIFLTLNESPEQPIVIPSGSVLLARLFGGRGAPEVRIGDDTLAFERVDSANWQIEHTVAFPGITSLNVSVRQGGKEIKSWAFRVMPDIAPAIAFVEEPTATQRAALRIEYEAQDDFGLDSVQARITRPGAPSSGAADGAGRTRGEIVLTLPLPGRGGAGATSYNDLTAHPWAGLDVAIQLEARDSIGQTGASGVMRMTLPERQFNHPVARAIVALRKALVRDPARRAQVAAGIGDIMARPESFSNDIVVFLALSIVRARLRVNGAPGAIDSSQALMWDAALRVEDGSLSLAERQLREVERQLQNALRGDIDEDELERLMSELKAALDRFLQAAQDNLRDALARGETPQLATRDPDALALQSEDLQSLVDRARALAQTGNTEAARALLRQLQEMLEGLTQPQTAEQGNSPADEALQALRDIIEGQRKLLDQTFRQSQRDEMADDAGAADAARQRGLRGDLGDVMRALGEMLGEIPENLGAAERAMKRSEGALGEGSPGRALAPQAEAIENLQQGARQALRAMAQRLGRQPGQGFGFLPGQPGQQGRDPLGRGRNGNYGFDTTGIKIPEESDVQRAREILDELRARAGERNRPVDELDYIERLIDRF